MRAPSVSLNTHCVVPENDHTPPTPRENSPPENFKRVLSFKTPSPLKFPITLHEVDIYIFLKQMSVSFDTKLAKDLF